MGSVVAPDRSFEARSASESVGASGDDDMERLRKERKEEKEAEGGGEDERGLIKEDSDCETRELSGVIELETVVQSSASLLASPNFGCGRREGKGGGGVGKKVGGGDWRKGGRE